MRVEEFGLLEHKYSANDRNLTRELFIYRVLVQGMVMTWLDTK
jgi:hypothetical protein